jgi:hypothetical protein
MRVLRLFMLIGLGVFVLSGCYRYACPAPDGVSCKPISEVYKKSTNGTLLNNKTLTHENERSSKGTKRVSYKHTGEKNIVPSKPGQEVEDEIKIQGPIVLPIKIYKYVDSEGDLHRPGYIFVVINRENWTGIEEDEAKSLYPKTPVNYHANQKEETNETPPAESKQAASENNSLPPGNLHNLADYTNSIPTNFQTDLNGSIK